MNYFNNNKWWVIIVAVLIVLNTATLTIFWIERRHQNKSSRTLNTHVGVQEYLSNELAFDSTQKKMYQLLINDHRELTKRMRQNMRNAKDDFYKLLNDTTASETIIKKAAINANEIEQQLDMLTFNHFKKIRSI